jgi:aminopeptidase YwaD
MRKCIVLLSFLGVIGAVTAQLEEARRITKTLCSSGLYGRGYVNKGDSIAAQFLGQEFTSLGLKNLKNQTSHFQSFSHNVVTFPGAMLVILNQDTLVPGEDFMIDPNSGSSNQIWKYKHLSPTELFDENIENRFNSSVIKEREKINACIVDIRNLHGDSLKKVKGIIIPILAQQLDVLVITNEKFTFSVGSEPYSYSLIYVKGNFNEITSLSTNIQSRFKENYLSTNVIGMIPAIKKTKQTIVLSAHYDHLGKMGANTYFPGANDNASGVAMLLELARYYSKNPTKYNIVFIAFAGEEAGLLGSSYFVQYPLLKLEDIHFLINLDIMGSGEEGITVVNATLHPEKFEELSTINKQFNYLPIIKQRGKAANSDHYWFSERGVPAFFIYTMGPNKNYHDVFDTYENLSFSKFIPISELLKKFINGL